MEGETPPSGCPTPGPPPLLSPSGLSGGSPRSPGRSEVLESESDPDPRHRHTPSPRGYVSGEVGTVNRFLTVVKVYVTKGSSGTPLTQRQSVQVPVRERTRDRV